METATTIMTTDLPLRVLGPRVLIRPDLKTHTPEQTDSGIFLAKSLTAAATGEDVVEWYDSGTVVALGEADAPFDVRPFVLRRLRELIENVKSVDDAITRLVQLRDCVVPEIEALPTHKPRDFNVGDRVTFSYESGQQITINGDVYLVMGEDEILAVVEPSKESA